MNTSNIDTNAMREFPFDKVQIPARFHEALQEITTVEPGLKSGPCEFVLEHFESINSGNMLILAGHIGCGKTFAAYVGLMLYVTIRSYRLTPAYSDLGEDVPESYSFHRSDRHGLVVTAHDVIKAAFDSNSPDYPNFGGLLVVDDLGREHFTDKGFGISEWDHFFDRRYSQMLPTIITTNLSTDELVEKYNRRIYDRMRETATFGVFTGGSLRSPKTLPKGVTT